MKFSDYAEFERFLEARQLEGYRMCQPRGTKYVQKGTVAVRHYSCVAEGESRSNSQTKRYISKLGTGSCNASFVARYSVDENKKAHGNVVLSRVQLNHSHGPIFKAQDVPSSVRKHIVEELQRGVTPEKVASGLQQESLKAESRAAAVVNRMTFLRKSYFKAQQRLLIAREIELDKNEHLSVSRSVVERWQDATLHHHPLGADADGISADIFCLILASSFQRNLLGKYGGEFSMVFFDATHDTSRYREFYLFTLVVADHSGHGYPAAWMITNRKNAAIQAHFLKVVREAVPLFDPAAFMVDEDPAARSAVRTVFNNARIYFCDFHLWRLWKAKLSSLKIPLTPELEGHLRVLRRSAHKEDFDASLEFLKEHCAQSNNGGKFWEYLVHNYMHDKAKYWVGYMRFFPYATNNHAESWHNQLKTNHLKRKSKMRLDQYTYLWSASHTDRHLVLPIIW